MKLFIDESGSTGQPLIDIDGLTNYKDQPFFCLAGILVENKEQVELLENLVDKLKATHRIQSAELKSKNIYETKPQLFMDLFQKLYEEAIPIFWELMDKKYYLCMQITNTFILPPHALPFDNDAISQRRVFSEGLYSILPDNLFSEFCDLCLEPSKDNFEQLLEKLITFFKDSEDPIFDVFSKSVLMSKDDYSEMVAQEGDEAFKKFLPLPDIDKRNRTVSILPNTHAFANLIARCEKYRQDNELAPFVIIHDEQKHFDEILRANFETMKNTNTDELLKDTIIAEKSIYKIHENVSISFEDSKQHKMIQLADLIAGFIMRSWSDFFYGNFKSLNRYIAVWQYFILEDKNGEPGHPSVGANMVIPEFHYALLIRHLRKF